VAAHNNALGATSGLTTVNNGGTLALQGGVTVAEAITLNGSGAGSAGALRNLSGNNTVSAALTLGSDARINSDAGLLTLDVTAGNAITATNRNVTFGGAGDTTVADPIATGSGTLTKDGSGTLTLAAANTYTGATAVSAGTLVAANAAALGTTAAGTTVSGGATLALQGGITVSEALTLDGSGAGGSGALRNLTGNNTVAGAITLAGDTRIQSDAGALSLNVATGNAISGTDRNLTLGGAGDITAHDPIATGSGTLTKDGGGTLSLLAANTYTGATTVSAGTLLAGHSSALGSSAAGSTRSGSTPPRRSRTAITISDTLSSSAVRRSRS
jgi:autotransporter-associated beta strand protein